MPVKEYIDREAALSAQNKSMNLNEMRERLKRIPAADVRPVVRGRWIETKTGFHCSACKAKAKGTKDGALLSNYCPNCGAKMEES